MNFIDIIVITIIIWLVWVLISTLFSRGKALRTLAGERGWKLTERGFFSSTPLKISGPYDEYKIKIMLQEAVMSRVFGGKTEITLTFPEPLSPAFTLTGRPIVPSLAEKVHEKEVTLGEAYPTGRVRIEGDDRKAVTALFSDEALLSELRGFMNAANREGVITEKRITFSLDGHRHTPEELLFWLKNTADLATTLKARCDSLR